MHQTLNTKGKLHSFGTITQRSVALRTMQCCLRPSVQAGAWGRCRAHDVPRFGPPIKRGGRVAVQQASSGLVGKGSNVEAGSPATAGAGVPRNGLAAAFHRLLEVLWQTVVGFLRSVHRVFTCQAQLEDGLTMVLMTAVFCVAIWHI